ncbi:MAG: 3-dehydroquinate synthase [Thermoguttaceae bacterium]|nr:3-dehydroquinate synthase [Thermoguttaceae bacterium]
MSVPQQRVRVSLGPRSYDIEIEEGNLERTGEFVASRIKVSHAVVITDEHVEEPHGRRVAESLAEHAAADLVVVPAGEPSKSVATAAALWEKLLQLGTDRKSVVVAVGGGVIGDLAGFVAATFARGIPFFQVPTSLLAQVDSSVGGKVGINLPEAKNMVGAFLQPQGVLIDTATLETLPEREYRSGLGEVVKYGVILDADFFAYLETNVAGLLDRHPEVLSFTIARCCRLKADIVEQDEREETGLRAVLNYGHTFGHAFEALAGYGELLHGEAVAIGMDCAARLACRLGRVGPEFVQRQRRLLAALGLSTQGPLLEPDQVLRTMMHDKKVAHGRLRFVLPSRMGAVDLVGDVSPEAVRDALADTSF